MSPHSHVPGEELHLLRPGSKPRAILRMVQFLQDIEARYLDTGKINRSQFLHIKRYLAGFVNTPRGNIYRLPTLAEFYAQFPLLKVRRARLRKVRAGRARAR